MLVLSSLRLLVDMFDRCASAAGLEVQANWLENLWAALEN